MRTGLRVHVGVVHHPWLLVAGPHVADRRLGLDCRVCRRLAVREAQVDPGRRDRVAALADEHVPGQQPALVVEPVTVARTLHRPVLHLAEEQVGHRLHQDELVRLAGESERQHLEDVRAGLGGEVAHRQPEVGHEALLHDRANLPLPQLRRGVRIVHLALVLRLVQRVHDALRDLTNQVDCERDLDGLGGAAQTLIRLIGAGRCRAGVVAAAAAWCRTPAVTRKEYETRRNDACDDNRQRAVATAW